VCNRKIDENNDRGSRRKSHGPYRPFLKGAPWPTDAEGSHVHAPSGSRRKYRLSPLQKKIVVIFGSLLVFHKYWLNITELRIQSNIESTKFSLRAAFSLGFPEIIKTPITESEVKYTIKVLKNKN